MRFPHSLPESSILASSGLRPIAWNDPVRQRPTLKLRAANKLLGSLRAELHRKFSAKTCRRNGFHAIRSYENQMRSKYVIRCTNSSMEDSAVSSWKLRQKHLEHSSFPALRDRIRDMTVRMIMTLCPVVS